MSDNQAGQDSTELLTKDSLFDGQLICYQRRNGYRFSVDSVLLAHFCRIRPGDRVLDLGCGSGIVGLILVFLHKEIVVTGLEIQESLVNLARINVRENSFDARMEIRAGDACSPGASLEAESFDLVVCNPPYRPVGSGRISQADEAAIARHELRSTLADMVAAAFFAVKNKRSVCFVYPAAGMARLLSTLAEQRLIVKRVQPVYSYEDSDQASLILVEAVKNGGPGCRLAAPFYVYAGPDRMYSPALRKLYKGERIIWPGLESE